VVTLDAAAAPGNRFASWGGACSGAAATCDVTMDQARSVTATFENATPAIGKLEVSPSEFTASPSPTPIERAGGATIKVNLSEAARVSFRVRRSPARRGAGPPPRRARKFERDLELGGNKVPFTGTLGGRTFAPGRYQLIARATDAGGLRSGRVRTTFRIRD
jgi:hypothetical protein